MIFLVTRPEHDPGTISLSEYSIAIIDFAMSKGHDTVNCFEKNVTKKTVKALIEKKNPDLILFNGHGNDDLILGQDYEPIIRMEDIELIKDRIVYARTCKTASVMGKTCGEVGKGAFIGFDAKFRIWTSLHFGLRPLEDPYSKITIEPSNIVAISLLRGCTVEDAVLHGKDAYRKVIKSLENSVSNESLNFLLPALYWNKEHLCAHGDLKLSL